MSGPGEKAPPGKGGARDSFVGTSRFPDTLTASRAQYLIARHAILSETAVIVAALAFGGPA